uniref:Dynactin subunit 5 n=1 Tax=Homo sapiens TaxID=9606 RepID=B4DS97_HUMAN|nr:unnamed protein product [Homo sapiens]
MELGELLYNKSEYIETASGNKVSRQSVLCGSQNIVLNGKTIVMNDCIIRGDLANVRVGRHCVVKSRSVIRPPFKKFSKGVAFFPLHIGDHVFIEEDCVVNATQYYLQKLWFHHSLSSQAAQDSSQGSSRSALRS